VSRREPSDIPSGTELVATEEPSGEQGGFDEQVEVDPGLRRAEYTVKEAEEGG